MNEKELGKGVLKQDKAMRVIFFYNGEEGTYVDDVNVTLYENGIVDLSTPTERTTAHISNVEILWFFEEGTPAGGQKMRAMPA